MKDAVILIFFRRFVADFQRLISVCNVPAILKVYDWEFSDSGVSGKSQDHREIFREWLYREVEFQDTSAIWKKKI